MLKFLLCAEHNQVVLALSFTWLFRAKNFHSSARPRRVLSYLGRVDFQKHLSYGTSRVCLKKMFFSTEVWVPKHFWHCKLAWVSRSLVSSHGNFPVFASVFREYLVLFFRWRLGSTYHIWKWRPRLRQGEQCNYRCGKFCDYKEVIKPVKKYEESRIRKFQPTWYGKKNFPVCSRYPTIADKASQLYVGINESSASDFRRDSLVSHEKSHSHYFCFQRAKSEEKPEQASLQRISHKIDKESKESS